MPQVSLDWVHIQQEVEARTVFKEGACILDMCNIVRVAKAAMAAELLGWVGAAFLDGLGLLPPVCLVCIPGWRFDLREHLSS